MTSKIDFRCNECKKANRKKFLKKVEKEIMKFQFIYNEEAVKLVERINKMEAKLK